MSAITLAQNTISRNEATIQKSLLEKLVEKFPELPSVEEIMADADLAEFFSVKNVKTSRKKTTPEERRGVYNGEMCDSRTWHPQPGTVGSYDDVQCGFKKSEDCFCKRHARAFREGKLWCGKITDPRPENPEKPDGTLMYWSTDLEGNEIMKEKKKKTTAKKNVKKTKDELRKEMQHLQDLLNESDDTEDLDIDHEEHAEEEHADEEHADEDGSSDEGSSDEDSASFKTVFVKNKEYQVNLEDGTVMRMKKPYKRVGEWDAENEKIDFN